MAEIKWIKITTTMFDDEKLKLIDSMPERDTIFYIWIRLLTQAGKTNACGYIFLTESVPYTDEMLSTIFNRPLNSVRLALQTLKGFGMIDILDNQLIKITNWEKHQNVDGMEKVKEQNRLRKQKQREKEKVLLGAAKSEIGVTIEDSHVMSRDSHGTEVEVEVEVDIEVEKETTTTAKERLSIDYVNYFQNNIRPGITSYEKDILDTFVSDGMEPQVLILAMQEAIEAGVRDMRYLKTVLNRWLDNNLKTVEAVLQDKKEYEHKKNKKVINQSSNVKKQGQTKGNFNNFEQRTYEEAGGINNIAEKLQEKQLSDVQKIGDLSEFLKNQREAL